MSTVSVAGRTTPTGARPAELDNRHWLQTRYLEVGDRAISEELGVSRGTVIRARQRLGIRSESPGRRRGGTPSHRRDGNPGRRVTDHQLPDAIRLIGDRYSDDIAAPTDTLIGQRLVDLHHARGQREDRIAALIDLGSAIALNLEHELALRRAA